MNVANLVKERCIVGDTVRFLKPFVGDSGKKVAQIVTDGKKAGAFVQYLCWLVSVKFKLLLNAHAFRWPAQVRQDGK